MEAKGAHFSSGTRRVAVELGRVKVFEEDHVPAPDVQIYSFAPPAPCQGKSLHPCQARKKGTGLKNSQVLDITLRDMKMRVQMSSAGRETLPSTSQ